MQHVEADAAGGVVAPREEFAPVAALVAVSGVVDFGADAGVETPVYGLAEVFHTG